MDCENGTTFDAVGASNKDITKSSFVIVEDQKYRTKPNRWYSCSLLQSTRVYVESDQIHLSSNIETENQHNLDINESAINPWFFCDTTLCQEYTVYKKQYFQIFSKIPNLLVLFIFIATHNNFQQIGTDSSAYYLFTAGFLLTNTVVSIFFIYAWAQVALARKWYNGTSNTHRKMKERCNYIVHRWFWGRIEDMLLISSVISGAFVLIGRLLVGQCPPDNVVHALWSAQACNPFAASGGIPIDTVISLYALPLTLHMLWTGITVCALIIGWIIIVGAVVFAVVYVNSPMLLYVVLVSVLFISMSFEFERRMRISFIQTCHIKENKKREFDYKITSMKKDHELQILALSKESEKKLMEAETFQLRGLMGNVAHDLKTPLHSITAELEIMKSETKSFIDEISDKIGKDVAVKFENTISTIFESLDGTCNFMTMAINRSQDFMKASSNIALVPHNETFDLAKTIATAVGYIKSVQSGRILVIDPLPPGICTHIISDKQWLCENLMCFVSNAVKYSDRGAQVNISTALEMPQTSDSVADLHQSMLHFMVEDTGVGIAKSVRPLLFQPFKQAQRMAGGTGLGLYSLAKRVEALGGSCGVKERRNGSQGSMFWFKIPYRPDETMVLESSAPINVVNNLEVADVNNDNPSSDDSRLSFLIVDDTYSILKVLERALKKNGHVVVKAENGSQSLELLKKSYETGKFFDVVITDLQMPVLDGFESVRRFREFELTFSPKDGSPKRHQLVIGMSANSDAQSRQDALDVGMDDFVSKPFKYEDLTPIRLKHLKF